MNKSLLFFDDERTFLIDPITNTRAAADLRCGIFTISEKWKRYLNIESVFYRTRPELQDLYPNLENLDPQVLCINGRWMPDEPALKAIARLELGQALCKGSLILAARPNEHQHPFWLKEKPITSSDYDCIDCNDGTLITRAADLFLFNEQEILRDKLLLKEAHTSVSSYPGVMYTEAESISIGKDVRIEPGVILIPDGGFIHIGDGAHLQAGSAVRGTCSIGQNATLKMGSQIYSGTTIGPHCKVGGEIQNSVFFGYSNKSHGGFVGNSVVGEWVNIGADTNTSNLKNNYTNIRIDDWHTGASVDTGLQFFGSIFADHVKIAIGSKLNSGSQFGVGSSFISRDFSPKRLPHFAWYTDEVIEAFEIERALQTARSMMMRRSLEMSPAMEMVLRHLAAKG